MKKVVHPNQQQQPTLQRKVYGTNTSQHDQQMNTAKKINSLLSSGAVSVTGPTQQRIVKQQQQPQKVMHIGQSSGQSLKHCYVCDEVTVGPAGMLLTEAVTTHTGTKVPNKIGKVVGEAFMVIISVEDVVCKRCISLFNHMDRLEHDLDRVKANIQTLINKKYGITDEAPAPVANKSVHQQPPQKMQRLNTGQAYATNRKTSNGADVDEEVTVTRRVNTSNRTIDPLDASLSNIFDSPGSDKPQQLRQNTTITPVHSQAAAAPKKPSQPTKIYKCMSCDFKTVDLKQFQPHYETCKQQSTGYRCKICKKLFTNMNALKVHTAEKHPNEYACSICSINYQNEAMLRKHMETNHPDIKTIESSSTATGAVYSCNQCAYKTPDKQVLEEHQRKHAVKVRPFKCRLCSQRFETREQASVHAKSHQPDYFKCGKCNSSFPQRDLLMKHFETHKPQNARTQGQQLQQQHQLIQQQQIAAAAAAVAQQDLTTQKLLQDTIDEALRDTGDADSKIHFFSCNICSLTFIQENYYNQHMETHKRDGKKPGQSQATASSNTSNAPAHSLIKHEYKQERSANATVLHSTQPGSISDADIESMFEKMHSDKVELGANAAANSNNTESMVITSQGTSASGNFSYSITIPKTDGESMEVDEHQQAVGSNGGNMSIDMPVLDQTEEQGHPQPAASAVSMPSLDDDGETHQQGNIDHLPMDLEEMQNAAESGQIKFILNEDGQILQLDNHIITTDADGNQILVQGTDSEQIQQLLQSVGVLQAGEGDGETFQMIQGENNQMIIVQGDNNEAQLIDASMLNEDGHLVIQQQEGEELPEGMHVVGEDGVQVPVSISYAAAGGQEQHEQVEHQQLSEEQQLQLQQQLEQQQLELEQQLEDEQQQSQEQPESNTEESGVEHHDDEEAQASAAPEMEDIEDQINAVVIATTTGQEVVTSQTSAISSSTTTATSNSQPNVSSSTGEVFFNIEDLMQQPDEEQEADGSTAEQK